MAGADRALDNGDIATACLIYTRLGNRRNGNPIAKTAKQRLTKIRQDAHKEVAKLDSTFENVATKISPSGHADSEMALANLTTVFHDYDRLLQTYRTLPGFRNPMVKHVGKQTRRAGVTTALKEAQALKLWKQAQEHERLGSLCCAYRVYETTKPLLPAPSAKRAQQRLQQLARDTKVVESVEKCLQMEKLHKQFDKAKWLGAREPKQARKLLHEVVAQTSTESPLHQAARKLLMKSL